jgi:hypothetical protein
MLKTSTRLAAVFFLGLAGPASASTQMSIPQHQECYFLAGIYGAAVKTFRDRGLDIPFSEVERAERLMNVLFDYGIREYGPEKSLKAAKEIGKEPWIVRARQIGEQMQVEGGEVSIARMAGRLRECEDILQMP